MNRTLMNTLVALGLALLVVLVALQLAAGVAVTSRVAEAVSRHLSVGAMMLGVVAAAAAAVTALVLLVWLVCRTLDRPHADPTCKACGRRDAVKALYHRLVGQEKRYGLVTRTAYTDSSGHVSGVGYTTSGLGPHGSYGHYSSGYTSGEGITTWQERVPVLRNTYEVTMGCKFCQDRWTKTTVREVEDFSRP